MAAIVTNRGKFRLGTGATVWTSATIKAALLKDSYTPSVDHNFMSDVTAHECDATGYAGGFSGADRLTLGSKSATEDDTNDRLALAAGNPTWSAIGGASNNNVRYVAIYEPGTSDSDSHLLAVLDNGASLTTNGSDITGSLTGGNAILLS